MVWLCRDNSENLACSCSIGHTEPRHIMDGYWSRSGNWEWDYNLGFAVPHSLCGYGQKVEVEVTFTPVVKPTRAPEDWRLWHPKEKRWMDHGSGAIPSFNSLELAKRFVQRSGADFEPVRYDTLPVENKT